MEEARFQAFDRRLAADLAQAFAAYRPEMEAKPDGAFEKLGVTIDGLLDIVDMLSRRVTRLETKEPR